ncbi:hypothetical protein F4808DRAFT_217677 [Astrocystis sublimbata]|nr:hypothetical protein F4808DRAFT_217677 [Astrocystis sublimbata]
MYDRTLNCLLAGLLALPPASTRLYYSNQSRSPLAESGRPSDCWSSGKSHCTSVISLGVEGSTPSSAIKVFFF